MRSSLRIGHIDLATSARDGGEHLIRLVQSLAGAGHAQHIVVSVAPLARRLQHIDDVTISPVTSAAITACCLMHDVDVVHAHEPQAARAALLMLLTRSIPYVLTHRGAAPPGRNPVGRASLARAATVVCTNFESRDGLARYDETIPVEQIPDICRESLDSHPMDSFVARAYEIVYRRALAYRPGSPKPLL